MSATLAAYLPQDRLRALSVGTSLPDHTRGAALFADISGFTPLTERLRHELGPRRGIEELTHRINAVYSALVAVVERHGGSVIDFAGDAITCWFAQASPSAEDTHAVAWLAVACAWAMQDAMRAFTDLALKVAVTCGPARRFVVGDPAVQRLDTLAGATVTRLAEAEHLAARGEIVVDEATATLCATECRWQAWRVDERTHRRYAPLAELCVAPALPPALPVPENLVPETLRAWVQPPVYALEQSAHGALLTELRPAVALFLRFAGIDYDADEAAGEKLDAFIRAVQSVTSYYAGTLIQITIGDKGSYLYCAFGAPVAHEDDVRRAVQAALELRQVSKEFGYIQAVQIGISRGTMRVGAYGSATRRTYGVLGDEVNLAARLMQAAGDSEILVSARIQLATAAHFTFDARPPLQVKGKRDTLSVFTVRDHQRTHTAHLFEPAYALPLVGRQADLAAIQAKLRETQTGQAQLIGISAEAGMGKSRLAVEAARMAQAEGFALYVGASESSGTNRPYLTWQGIWHTLFELDPTGTLAEQERHLEHRLALFAPDRSEALPLLGALLELPLAENAFTRALAPKHRKSALEALLEDYFRAFLQRTQPSVFVLEDAHWMDALSQALLDVLIQASLDLPVCFLLVYRPTDGPLTPALRVAQHLHFTQITLAELEPAEAASMIRNKLAQLFPAHTTELPEALVTQVSAKAQGNPFFIEELLNYLHDYGIDPYATTATTPLTLPNSLHTLILSRIDQLSETQKITLKVASVIGRVFPVTWLHAYYPELGALDAVRADLSVLARLDLTPLDTPDPNLTYLFKHIVTQEVAYESMAFATRTELHARLAQFLEGHDAERFLALLAFHYGHSAHIEKKREYWLKAGEAAQASFANASAVEHYTQWLTLPGPPRAQMAVHIKRGNVFELLGEWSAAEADYRAALQVATRDLDALAVAECEYVLGLLLRGRGDFDLALEWLARARTAWEAQAATLDIGRVTTAIGSLHWRKGEFAMAEEQLSAGLRLARAADDQPTVITALINLGNLAALRDDYDVARAKYAESLTLMRAIHDRRGEAGALNNLGIMAFSQGDWAQAQTLYSQSLALSHEVGDRQLFAATAGNLGTVAYLRGDYQAAHNFYQQCLTLQRQIGAKPALTSSINNLGALALKQDDYATARRHYTEGLELAAQIGNLREVTYSLIGAACLAAECDPTPLRAARLLGAVEGVRAEIGLALELIERGTHERALALVRAALPPEVFERAFAEGTALARAEALTLAFEVLRVTT